MSSDIKNGSNFRGFFASMLAAHDQIILGDNDKTITMAAEKIVNFSRSSCGS